MPKRIRVLQMFYTFDIEVGGGGLTRFAVELGKGLDPDLFDVILVSLGFYHSQKGQECIDQLNAGGIRAYEATRWVENKPYRSFLQSIKTLSKEIARHPVDILHSHSEYTDVSAIILKLTNKIPYVIRTVHYGYQYEWRTKPMRRILLTNFFYPILFHTEIGVSQANTTRLNRRRIARLFRREAVCIHNAIPVESFTNLKINTQEKKISLGIPPSATVIGTVGRLADQKGYEYLIGAAQLVLQEYPQAFFLIIGDGPLADELKDMARQKDIARQVIFTGGRSDVGELLACMDLFVSSSLWEGLPTVLLEAMACNIPIVATNIPGTKELIKHRENGWLVPPSNSEELGKAIIYMIKSPTLRLQIARQAQIDVDRFSIKSISKEYEALYESLCNPTE